MFKQHGRYTSSKEKMKTVVIRQKIKPNAINEVKQWFQTLRERKTEVLESMKNEGIVVESAFLDNHGEEFFLIYYIKAENIEHAYEVFNKSTLEIDIYFKNKWDQLLSKGRVVLEELLDLNNLSL